MANSTFQTSKFSGVTVGLPSKVRGVEVEEEWQEVDWVTGSIGDVIVYNTSFQVVFKSSQSPNAEEKLGRLINASVVSEEDGGRILVVTVFNTLNKFFRFTFQSAQYANEFLSVAQAGEVAFDKLRASKSDRDDCARSIAGLNHSLNEKLGESWPLFYSGAELYSLAHESNEKKALFKSSTLVLIDMPDGGKGVGTYELRFYPSEDFDLTSEPCLSLFIGSDTSLKMKGKTCEDDTAMVSFELTVKSARYILAFVGESTSGAFLRDFRVRQQLMQLSSHMAISRHGGVHQGGQVRGFSCRSLCSCLTWTVILIGILLLVFIAGSLHLEGEFPSGRYAQALLGEFLEAVRSLQRTATAACHSDHATGVFNVSRCIKALLGNEGL